MSQGLILEGVHFGYDGAPILDNIHLHVPPGQFVSLLGASGSGKSTLLRLAAGLLEPARGRLYWAGRPLKGPGLERGVVFQDYALFPWMTVVDNLALAIGKARPRTPSAARRQEAHHALARVGLDDIGDKYPFELSGGMRQRAAIARALAIGSPLYMQVDPKSPNKDMLTQIVYESSRVARCYVISYDTIAQNIKADQNIDLKALDRRTAAKDFKQYVANYADAYVILTVANDSRTTFFFIRYNII